MRQTKQRSVILEELRKHVDHPGADDVYHEVRKVLSRISLGTVYRNLELLSEKGVIKKLELGSGQKRFHRWFIFYFFSRGLASHSSLIMGKIIRILSRELSMLEINGTILTSHFLVI